jgi:hypothetical protein
VDYINTKDDLLGGVCVCVCARACACACTFLCFRQFLQDRLLYAWRNLWKMLQLQNSARCGLAFNKHDLTKDTCGGGRRIWVEKMGGRGERKD